MDKLIADVATLKENSRWANNKIESMDKKIDQLLEFKWRIIGISSVVGFVSALVTEIVFRR
jgi:hypothetical protein